MREIKLLTFDLDDTLIKTRKAKVAVHLQVANERYRLNRSEQDVLAHWGKPFQEIISEIYGQVDTYENLLEVIAEYSQHSPVIAYEETMEVLNALSGITHLAILTATNKQFAYQALQEAGIDHELFSYIQTSDDTMYHKPDPQVFAPLLAHFEDLDTTQILYVGDSPNDGLAAIGAGLEFRGVAGHTHTTKDFEKLNLPTIENLSDLIPLVS